MDEQPLVRHRIHPYQRWPTFDRLMQTDHELDYRLRSRTLYAQTSNRAIQAPQHQPYSRYQVAIQNPMEALASSRCQFR